MDILICVLLVMLSGMFSGLTLGLMGLSYTEVKRASDLGDMRATKILPLISNNNKLLVTLLLGNTATNATISIFLGSVVGEGVVAGAIATIVILIFGEILPSALLTKYALNVGSAVAPFVSLLVTILTPVTFIARFLDKYVGKVSETYFTKHEIAHIIETHAASSESDIDKLDKDVMLGTLSLSSKKIGEHMSAEMFTTRPEVKIDSSFLELIKNEGYTRIPVIENKKIIGVLNCKHLIGIDLSKEQTVANLMIDNKTTLDSEMKLDEALPILIKSHIAGVLSYGRLIGVITLEDVVEELLKKEIKDEFDNE